ncbi:FHA domain-containing protein [Cellulomonas chengniuliangii]|uniref:FHA domain-containing protein n=1 Tax=Cellulomonas chengniuliangii TaxID=2968084 RepID=UPI001D0ECB9F|nr:FHA domain-containing protein [Cellulomonas chengniuliangii]MCC2318258.1 FHA domain-containing protein [Cellulomonas chengniuliangii]
MNVPEYTPGTWHAVVAHGMVALLAPSTPAETVRAVWDAAPTHGGIADQLEVLLRGGISGLQPFALVDVTSGRVHAALRGEVEVEVSGAGGARVLTAGEVTTWSERVAEGADVMTVRVSGAPTWSGTTAWPIATGVVRADGVRVALAASSEAGLASPVVASPVDASVGALGGEPLPGEPVPAVEPLPAPEPEPASEPEAAVSDEPAPVEPTLASEAVVWASELEGGSHRAADPVADAGGLIEGAPAWLLPPAEEPAPSVAFDAPAAPSALDAPLDQVGGAPQAPATDAYGGSEPATAHLPMPGQESVVAEAEAVLHAQQGAVATGEVPPDDHDGLTILSSDLVAIRDQLPSWAGDEVPGPFRVVAPAPPAVSRLVLSTGAVVPLDRSVLLGRAPQVLRVTNSEIPRLVSVPSPQQDISRTHAEVRAEGEDVLVTDLQSTNGVLVSRDGERARRLHPGEPTVVRPGELVDLGDGVTFTVERGT